jgi:trehalose utilization protein
MDIVVWNENVHESRGDATVLSHYPDGIHAVVADGLRELLGDEASVGTATLQDPEHGLTEERLAATDVLYWWGHVAHGEVSDEVVERVIRHVHAGMGLVVLHSGHYSKVFTRLMGTTCSLKWRNDGERELVWTIAPQHPIAEGIPHPIVIDRQEMYGEQFDIPRPDEEVFLSTFAGGEVFRSTAAAVGSSTSRRATRSTPCTTTPTSAACSRTPPAGSRPPRAAPISRPTSTRATGSSPDERREGEAGRARRIRCSHCSRGSRLRRPPRPRDPRRPRRLGR